MLEMAWAILTLCFPWLVGIQICRLALPHNSGWLLTLGAGFFIGYAIVALVLFLQDAWTGSIGFSGPLFVFLAIIIATWYLSPSHRDPFTSVRSVSLRPVSVFLVLFSASIALPVIADVWLRPLFPWDAWYTYGLQAKIYTHKKEIVEFVSQIQWLDNPRTDVFNTYVAHGRLIPLIQTWMGLGIGRWSESLVNLPWPLAWISLALLTGGAAQFFGISSRIAGLSACAVLSMPITGVHAVLAGYPDLWLAGFCMILIISLSAITESTQRLGWICLAVVAAVAAWWAKKYGGLFVGLGIAAWCLSLPEGRVQWKMLFAFLTIGTLSLVYLAFNAPFPLVISLGPAGELGVSEGVLYIPGFKELRLEAHGGGGFSLINTAFSSKSFGLMAWICLGLVGLSLKEHPIAQRGRFLGYWLLLSGFSTWIAFTYTQASRYAKIGTVVERHMMIVLLVTFVLALCASNGKSLSRDQKREEPIKTGVPV